MIDRPVSAHRPRIVALGGNATAGGSAERLLRHALARCETEGAETMLFAGDAIDLPMDVDGRRVVVIDTAGMRRQAKVTESVDYYTTLRSQRAVERADGNLAAAARLLGITRPQLTYRLKKQASD